MQMGEYSLQTLLCAYTDKGNIYSVSFQMIWKQPRMSWLRIIMEE